MGTVLNSKQIDSSVGGLVWIRRRNGSWWPGRIMGSNELTENCLGSSRPGTPVKLLGREDASLDWYNLEKSKRVKAFRCGKFRKCIEKAKVSATQANKKIVKFARREDAILHALEIESAREINKHHEFHLRMDGSAGRQHDTWVRQAQNMDSSGKEHEYMYGGGHKLDDNSMQELSQSGTSFEDPNHISITKVHSLLNTRQKTPNDSEDDGTERAKRMRGLEDLVMGVEPKTKPKMHFHTEGSPELVQQDSASVSVPDIHISLSQSDGSPVNSLKGSCSSLKKRQYQVTGVRENLRRKNRRRRTLAKVLENSAMVSVPVQGTSANRSSLQEETDRNIFALESEPKKTLDSLVINNNMDCTGVSCEKDISLDASVNMNDVGVRSVHFYPEPKEYDYSSLSEIPENDCFDSLFDVPLVGEERRSGGLSPIHVPCASRKLQSGVVRRQTSHSSPVGSISLSSQGLDESGSISCAVQLDKISQRAKKCTSRWQWKGYKSSRSLCKKTSRDPHSSRFIDRDCGSNDVSRGTDHMDGLPVGFSSEVDINTFDESLVSDNGAHWSNQIGAPNYLDTMKCGRRSLRNSEVVISSAERRSRQFYSSSEKSVAAKSKSQIIDDKLHLTRNMPFSPPMPQRSLIYRQSGFTTYSTYDEIADLSRRNIAEVSLLFDVNLEVRASYRGQHVPLVSLTSNLSGKAIIGHSLQVEVCDDGYCELLLTSSIDHCPTSCSGDTYKVPAKSYAKHSTIKSCLSPKRSTKNSKRGFNSKKTRKLSSFSVAPWQKEKNRKAVLEKLERPVIACVSLKIVFSRINEALNCSTRPTWQHTHL